MIRLFGFILAGGLVILAACGGSGGGESVYPTQGATPGASPAATPPWAEQQGELKSKLGEMVLAKEDLPTSLRWLEPVENPPEAIEPIIAPERDPLTMNGLP